MSLYHRLTLWLANGRAALEAAAEECGVCVDEAMPLHSLLALVEAQLYTEPQQAYLLRTLLDAPALRRACRREGLDDAGSTDVLVTRLLEATAEPEGHWQVQLAEAISGVEAGADISDFGDDATPKSVARFLELHLIKTERIAHREAHREQFVRRELRSLYAEASGDAPPVLVEGDIASLPVTEVYCPAGLTFGVELEFAIDAMPQRSSAWQTALSAARAALSEAELGTITSSDRHAHTAYTTWHIEPDKSAGLEVVSPILRGPSGLRALDRACRALRRCVHSGPLHISYRAGAHLNLGWRPRDADAIRRLVHLVHLFEPALATLVAPSRLVRFDRGVYDLRDPNVYARPISHLVDRRRLAEATLVADAVDALTHRRGTINVTHVLAPDPRLEIRLHGGTTNAAKLALWLELWARMLWVVDQPDVQIPEQPWVRRPTIYPSGDIVALASALLPDPNPGFLERLDRRRREIATLWEASAELHTWLAFTRHWSPKPAARGDAAVSDEMVEASYNVLEALEDSEVLAIARGLGLRRRRRDSQEEAIASLVPIDRALSQLDTTTLKRILDRADAKISGSRRDLIERAVSHAPGHRAAFDAWPMELSVEEMTHAFTRTDLLSLAERLNDLEVDPRWTTERIAEHVMAWSDVLVAELRAEEIARLLWRLGYPTDFRVAKARELLGWTLGLPQRATVEPFGVRPPQ